MRINQTGDPAMAEVVEGLAGLMAGNEEQNKKRVLTRGIPSRRSGECGQKTRVTLKIAFPLKGIKYKQIRQL